MKNLNVTQKMVLRAMRRRICKVKNHLMAQGVITCTLLEPTITYGQRFLRKKRGYYEDQNYAMFAGYEDGIYIAENMIKDNEYTFEKLREYVQKLPASYGLNIVGPAYGTGFFDGLFGKHSNEMNFFILNWKRKLIKEFKSLEAAA